MKTTWEKNKGLFNAIGRVLTARLKDVDNYMDDDLIKLYKRHRINDGSLSLLMDELRLTTPLLEIISNDFWKNEANLEINVFWKDNDVYRFYIKGSKKEKGFDVWNDGDCGFDYEADFNEADYSEDKLMGRILND